MRFGSREVCDIVIKDVKTQKPLLYLESMTMNSLSNTTATVYARGGKGFPKLIGWDGEKELRFENTDALISPESFALLTGADIIKGVQYVHQKDVLTIMAGLQAKLAPNSNANKITIVFNNLLHQKVGDDFIELADGDLKDDFIATDVTIDSANYDMDAKTIELTLTDVVDGATIIIGGATEYYNKDGVPYPKQVLTFDGTEGSWGISYVDGQKQIKYAKLSKIAHVEVKYPIHVFKTEYGVDIGDDLIFNEDYTLLNDQFIIIENEDVLTGDKIIADYYFATQASNKRMRITSDQFPKTFTLEANTLWRDEDGYDHQARIRIPRAKLEGSFTIEMAPNGDPATFTFNFECLKPKDGTDMLIMDIDEEEIYTEFSNEEIGG